MKDLRSTSLAVALSLLVVAACGKEKTCAADEQNVGGTCYALRSDPLNCGTVGHACAAAQGCADGACVECATSPAACTPDVVVACYNLNQVRPLGAQLGGATAPLATDGGPIAFASIGGALWVANSTSSTLSRITLAPPASTTGAAAVKVPNGTAPFADLEHLAAHGGLLWASNAATGTLVAIDPATGAAVDEVALQLSPSEFVNPQGLAFVGTKGYLALAGVNAVAVIDASAVPHARVVKRIDLATLATGTAQAAPSRIAVVGTRVYVTLNDLYDPTFAAVPGAHGLLATIDSANDVLVEGATDLGAACQDASGVAVAGTTLWIACGYYDYAAAKVVSGALVPVDVSGAAPVAGAPLPLANAATSIAICDGRGYAGASDSGTIIPFDPVARTVGTPTVVCPAEQGHGSYIPALACAR